MPMSILTSFSYKNQADKNMIQSNLVLMNYSRLLVYYYSYFDIDEFLSKISTVVSRYIVHLETYLET